MNLPTRTGERLQFSKHVLTCLTGNIYITKTNPSLKDYEAHINDFDNAETLVQTGGIGTVDDRDEKMDIVIQDMRLLKECVQHAADADPPHAVQIIESSGFAVRKVGNAVKVDFDVRRGDNAGEVLLIAKAAGNNATYQWEISEDGTNFTLLSPTNVAKALVTGLVIGKKYWFRCKSLVKGKWSDYSVTLSFIVH